LKWYEANPDRQKVNPDWDAEEDALVELMQRLA
jgi:hypothetical protein